MAVAKQCQCLSEVRTSKQMSESANFFLSSRNVLFHLLTRKCPVICFNAKDFVRTVLQFFGDDGCWKRGKSEPGPECRRPACGAGTRSGDGPDSGT